MSTMTKTRTGALRSRRFAGALGAVVEGMRLTGDLDGAVIEQIRSLLWEHKVLFFPGQNLTDAEHQAFGARLGPTFDNPTLPDDVIAEAGAIYELDGSRPDGRAETWHTDSTFCLAPPAAAVLRGVVIPAYGGDTCFANTVRAYETLTPQMQALADSLTAMHSNKFDYAGMRPKASAEEQAHFDKITTAKTAVTHHPLVRIHPHTGERSLMVGKYCQKIVGHTAEQSAALIGMFQQHITQLPNTARWRWTAGDIVIWDNQATQHCVVNDWGVQPRTVRRWTVGGSATVGIDGRPGVAVQAP